MSAMVNVKVDEPTFFIERNLVDLVRHPAFPGEHVQHVVVRYLGFQGARPKSVHQPCPERLASSR